VVKATRTAKHGRIWIEARVQLVDEALKAPMVSTEAEAIAERIPMMPKAKAGPWIEPAEVRRVSGVGDGAGAGVVGEDIGVMGIGR